MASTMASTSIIVLISTSPSKRFKDSMQLAACWHASARAFLFLYGARDDRGEGLRK